MSSAMQEIVGKYVLLKISCINFDNPLLKTHSEYTLWWIYISCVVLKADRQGWSDGSYKNFLAVIPIQWDDKVSQKFLAASAEKKISPSFSGHLIQSAKRTTNRNHYGKILGSIWKILTREDRRDRVRMWKEAGFFSFPFLSGNGLNDLVPHGRTVTNVAIFVD